MKKPLQEHIDQAAKSADSVTRGARDVPARSTSAHVTVLRKSDSSRNAGICCGPRTSRAPLAVWALSVAVAALFAVTGCQTGVSVSHTQAIGVPTFPPSDPAQVVILHTEPTRPHVRLGEVQVEPASDKTPVADIEGALRSEAAKLGADAVVIVADRMQITGAYVMGPWWGRSVDTVQGRVIVGVAIKYQ